MKKLKLLLVFLVALVLPVMVYAEGEENKEVNVYLFRGEGCPHCEEAIEWFNSIDEEYGSKFNIVDYETWYDEENAELMQKVAEARGEEASGVPYIIIGNKSWNGFTDSYESEMIAEIESEYAKAEADRYDIMTLLPEGSTKKNKDKDKESNDVLALIVILVVVGGVCFGIYKARSNTN